MAVCSCGKQSVNKQGCLGHGVLFYLVIGKSKLWTRLTNVTCNSMSVATNSSLEQRCVENHSCRIVTPPRLKNGISHIRSGDFHLFSRCFGRACPHPWWKKIRISIVQSACQEDFLLQRILWQQLDNCFIEQIRIWIWFAYVYCVSIFDAVK